MKDRKAYLKPNVVFEPLVDRWYAWSHLISPATAVMNISDRQMTIMDSYLMTPALHTEAVLNPKMRDGPFMDRGGGRLDEVKELQEQTVKTRGHMIEFAMAVKEQDKLLAAEAGLWTGRIV